jgi:RNase P protein component
MAPTVQPGWDVLIVARPESVAAGQEALASTLRALLERAGVVEGASNA